MRSSKYERLRAVVTFRRVAIPLTGLVGSICTVYLASLGVLDGFPGRMPEGVLASVAGFLISYVLPILSYVLFAVSLAALGWRFFVKDNSTERAIGFVLLWPSAVLIGLLIGVMGFVWSDLPTRESDHESILLADRNSRIDSLLESLEHYALQAALDSAGYLSLRHFPFTVFSRLDDDSLLATRLWFARLAALDSAGYLSLRYFPLTAFSRSDDDSLLDAVLYLARLAAIESRRDLLVGSPPNAGTGPPLVSQDTVRNDTVKIVFNSPDTVAVDEDFQIVLFASRVFTADSLSALLRSTVANPRHLAQLFADSVPLPFLAEAVLGGQDFNVLAITPLRQYLHYGSVTRWEWAVQGATPGTKVLYMTINAVLEHDGEIRRHTIQTYRQEIVVQITAVSSWLGWIRSNPWIVPIVCLILGFILRELIKLIAWLVRKRLGKQKRLIIMPGDEAKSED